jgi:hypothetical protein
VVNGYKKEAQSPQRDDQSCKKNDTQDNFLGEKKQQQAEQNRNDSVYCQKPPIFIRFCFHRKFLFMKD